MKKQPVIKAIESPDIDLPLQSWLPPDARWQLAVEVTIGLEDRPGADIFQFSVYSEEFVMEALSRNGWLMAGKAMVLKEFSYDLLISAIRSAIAEAAEPSRDWTAFAINLNWNVQWEYECYPL